MESVKRKQDKFEQGITGSPGSHLTRDGLTSEALSTHPRVRENNAAPRSSRTRTLIQLGGLLDKAGLATAFDIALGDDLQRDEHTFDPAATLLGALLELNKQLQEEGQNDISNMNQRRLWRLKGKKALME